MADKGSDFDVVEVGGVDGCGNDGASAIPSHTELWILLVHVLRQQIDSFRISIAAHEGDAGDVATVLDNEIVECTGVEWQSDVFPEILAVASRTVTRAIRNVNCQCHFVRNLLKNNPSVDVP